MPEIQFTFSETPAHYWILNPDGTVDLMNGGIRTPVTTQDGVRFIAPSMPITGANVH